MAVFTMTAPSGAGKSYFVKRMVDLRVWIEGISTTTRIIRIKDGEVDGKTYYFKSKDEFLEMDDNAEFAECVEYDGNYYGITKAEIERVQKLGGHIVIIVEHEGYKQIKELYPDSINIFLHMTKEDCMANMLLRGDSLEKALKRIELYDNEMKNSADFDYVVKNVRNKQDATLQILTAIVRQYN